MHFPHLGKRGYTQNVLVKICFVHQDIFSHEGLLWQGSLLFQKFSSHQQIEIPLFQQCWSVVLHNILTLCISVVSLPVFSRSHCSFLISLRLCNTSQQHSHFFLGLFITGIKSKCLLAICDCH